MAETLSALRAANPNPILDGADLLFSFREDGTPAPYTLTELAAYINGYTQPAYITNALQGATTTYTATTAHQGGLIYWSGIAYTNSGYFSQGDLTSMVVPAGVTKCVVSVSLRFTGVTGTLTLLKNGLPVLVSKGNGNISFTSHDIPVTGGDYFQVTGEGLGTIEGSLPGSRFSIRTTEKLT